MSGRGLAADAVLGAGGVGRGGCASGVAFQSAGGEREAGAEAGSQPDGRGWEGVRRGGGGGHLRAERVYGRGGVEALVGCAAEVDVRCEWDQRHRCGREGSAEWGAHGVRGWRALPGTVQNTWHSVPDGSIGGGVWSSVAASVDGQNVWVSTGNECDPTINACPAGDQVGASNSLVHLSGSLVRLEAWQAPGTIGGGQDSDFGSSPTLFGAGTSSPPDVGTCNKNGTYYAQTASPLSTDPLWSEPVGAAAGARSMCIASAVWNGATSSLYLSGDATTINAVSSGGSVAQADPTSGVFTWQTGLSCAGMGTPSLDASGVIAAVTYTGCTTPGTPALYLLDATTGSVLKTISLGGRGSSASPSTPAPTFTSPANQRGCTRSHPE